jgi:hypothetical protein
MKDQYSTATQRTCSGPCHAVASRVGGFTLVEMLVSTGVLVLLILVITQVINTTATTARPANKHIDTDSEARTVLDRIAIDFAQMLKRTDVDYYLKGPTNYNGHGNGHGWGRKLQTGQQGSDQIAAFSQVPGYYPSSGSQSPLSLVAYRVNQNSSPGNPSYLKLERMGKGLVWNGVSNSYTPLVFLPLTIAATWPAATQNDNSNNSVDSTYETIGPGVFRLEYYYVLKNGSATDVPWDVVERPDQTSLTTPINIGLTDVEAIVVVIAVIDSTSRSLISNASLLDLVSDLADFATAPGRGVGNQDKYIGGVEANWEKAVETIATTGRTSSNSAVPPEAAKAIRIYSRSFDLKSL